MAESPLKSPEGATQKRLELRSHPDIIEAARASVATPDIIG